MENDIVIVDSRMFVVHYYELFAMYMLKGVGTGRGGVNGMTVQISNSEVIGNKFDNLEMLEVENQPQSWNMILTWEWRKV